MHEVSQSVHDPKPSVQLDAIHKDNVAMSARAISLPRLDHNKPRYP
jgi:hypothetical protein